MAKKDLAVGIDIGGTNVCYGFVTAKGELLEQGNFSIREYDDPKLFTQSLAKRLKEAFAELANEFQLKGIGIGAPNGNFHHGTIEFAPNLKWKGIVRLADMFRDEMQVPVFLTNDANAAAIGEMMYGAAKGMRDFLMVTLGTGLGSGFVANGELILGHDGFAGELGHTIVYPDGRECGCGRKGCLETYTSATGVVRTALKLMANSRTESPLRAVSPNQLTARIIAEQAKKGDPLSVEVFDYTSEVLGMKLADAVAITSPEAIFLFGGLTQAGDLIFQATEKYMEAYLLPIYKNKVKILSSALPENQVAILGAAALIWKYENNRTQD